LAAAVTIPVRGHRRRPRPAADKPAVTRQRTCLCL